MRSLKLPTALSALKHHNFRYFLSGQIVSIIGTTMQAAAQQWLVYSITKSPSLLGLIGVFQFGPVLLLSLLAGVYIDRFPKRNLLILTQILFLIQSLILALLLYFSTIQYWQIAMLSMFYGIIITFDLPARQSFAIELVGREDLMCAISLNSTVFNICRIIGPSVSGIIILNYGTKMCFLLNTISFVPVIIALFMIDTKSFVQAHSNIHPLYEIGNGLKYIFKQRILVFTVVMLAIVYTFTNNVLVILPVFVSQTLKMDAEKYGLMISAIGVGAIFGAMLMASRSRKGLNLKVIVGGSLALSFVNIAGFFVNNFIAGLILMATIGFFSISFLNMCNSVLQISSSDEYRGRVMSIYSLLIVGTAPLGNSIIGFAMDFGGGHAGFLASGALNLIFVVPVMLIFMFRFKNKPLILEPAQTNQL